MNKVRIVFLFFICCFELLAHAQSGSDIQGYIARYTIISLEQERKYGIPAPITLAQGILESGAGKSQLARNSNNHFGIKAYGKWNGPVFRAWDDEAFKSPFRVYQSPEESYEAHSLFLYKENSRYASLFNNSVYNYRAWANGLQRAGYATSPTYAKALIGIIESYRLYAINGGVKLRPGKKTVITRTITIEEIVEEHPDLVMPDEEETEEEVEVKKTYNKYITDINDVRCTILCPGETLSSVAMRYDIPKSELLEFNELTNENDFGEGDIVFVEKKRNRYYGSQDDYRVKEGDTLYGISQKFGIKLHKLCKMNDKNIFSALSVGEKIILK